MNIKKDNLFFLPLGGSGEIGMNCNLYHYNDKWLMVDLGVMFSNADSDPYEVIMPKIDFIIEKKSKLSGLILTHAHEDHIGAVPYLHPKLGNIPIYTTSFTASVLKRKFESVGIKEYDINLFEYNKKFSIGSFKVEIFSLTHSIPEPNAIILKCKKGNIFHTGDWKIDPEPLVGDPIDEEGIKKIGKEGVTAMICDSTNVFNNNPSGSESEVRKSLKQIFSNKKQGKIIISCFASNIARLETILQVSKEQNKCCYFLGRSLHRIYESAIENNYLKQFNNIIDDKEVQIVNEDQLVVICTGSQGENRAGLSRIVNNNHKYVKLSADDLVIFSSREIPGNEKQINEIKKNIMKIGSKILDHNNSMVHVSGHPSKDELSKMYEWVCPRTLIPVHGEYRHLKEHERIAKQSGIQTLLVENGDVAQISNSSNAAVIDKVDCGRIFLDGSVLIDEQEGVISERKKLMYNGLLNVSILVNEIKPYFNFEMDLIGISTTVDFKNEILIHLENELNYSLGNNKPKKMQNIETYFLETEVRRILNKFLKSEIGKKPHISICIHRMDII